METRSYQDDPAYTYTFTKDGTYCVDVSAKDNDGEIVTVRSGAVTVTADSTVIGSVPCTADMIRSGDTAVFTAEATGGQAPLTYASALTKGGETVAQQEHGESSSFGRGVLHACVCARMGPHGDGTAGKSRIREVCEVCEVRSAAANLTEPNRT